MDKKVCREENAILGCGFGREGGVGPSAAQAQSSLPSCKNSAIQKHMAERWEASSRCPRWSGEGGKRTDFLKTIEQHLGHGFVLNLERL